ncbi:MAG TPA: heme-binding protein [Alphaproteobacteria bacterium]|nr:heme-binding protein [Alphaproteobacteria bacterium]
MSQVKEPKFKVIKSHNNLEIREYPPVIVAQVIVKGERKKAISAGFRVLAAYIFGSNVQQKKISMTAPVIQQEGEKIVMTAPVIQQESEEVGSWEVRFIMPSEYTLKTLPQPKDSRVELFAIPSKRYVVIRFSGLASAKSLQKQLEELRKYIDSEKLHTIGQPLFAFYNPPWTLPFLRRNEIMIELKE